MAKRDTDPTDFLATFRPATCTPEDVERLIALRVAQIDEQIKPHLSSVEEFRVERKKWLGVTGGRSLANGGADDEPQPEVAK